MSQPRFEMNACLGSGGFGEVYLATETTEGGIRREVAVKVLHNPLDEEDDAVRRLRDEGQLLAYLAHPAVLGVHAFAKVDGRLALVTEYVEGADLAYFCHEDRLLPTRVAILVTQAVAEALDFAWNTPNPQTGRPMNLIHRDLKPENVRLSTTGQVKLLDFGVARSTEIQRRAMTAAGQVILTPGYGAPETLMFGVLGPAVDVFALGITLYAMVTGQTFYDNEDLGHQVRLASDSVEYGAYCKGRLSLIEDHDLHALLRDMVEFAHEHRPTMAEVAERCERLARRIQGPSILQWTRQATFPEAATKEGRLDGAIVLSDGTVQYADAPDAEAPVPPPDDPTGEPPALPLSQMPTVIAPEELEDDEEEVQAPAPTSSTAPPPPPKVRSLPPAPAEPEPRQDLMLVGALTVVGIVVSLVAVLVVVIALVWLL